MKKLFVVLATLILLMMTSCGGGGGGSSDGTNETSEVNLKIVKGFMYGTATAGSQMSFTLTGSDTLGNAWNCSMTIVSDGTTTFENNNVTKCRMIVTFASPAVSTTTSADYYLASNGVFYKTVVSTGETWIPSTQNSPIPDNAKVGDSGSLSDLTSNDGTRRTSTWKLEDASNGNYKFVVSSVDKNASSVIDSREYDTYYIDSTGNAYKFSVTIELSDRTITMTGNRNTETATDDTTTSTSTSSTTTSITSTSSTITTTTTTSTTTTKTTTSTTTTTTGSSSGNCETTSDEDMTAICTSCTRVDVIRCSDDLDNPEAKMTIQYQGSNGFKSGICDSLDADCLERELRKVLNSCGCQTEF